MGKSVANAGIVTGVRTLKDKTVSFSIACQEMNHEDAGKLISLNGEFIKFLLTDNNVIADEVADELKSLSIENSGRGKSQGQRLRGVIYRYWEQKNSDMPFDTFYSMWMEKVINLFKSKLD